jgi:hypothetical protein
MQLKALRIELRDYGINEGKYTGEVSFRNQYGSVEVVLAPEISQQVLALCAGALVKNAQDVAQIMTASVLESTTKVLTNSSDAST